MTNPTGEWDRVPVFGFYFLDDQTPVAGDVTLSMPERVARVDGRRVDPVGRTVTCTIGDVSTNQARMIAGQVRDAWRASDVITEGVDFDGGAWDVWWDIMLTGAVFASFPAADDPDIVPNGYEVLVTEVFPGGKTYVIQPLLTDLDNTPPGVNLGLVDVPPGTAAAPYPVYARTSVTGSRGSNAALASVIAALVRAGIVVDNSTS